MQVIMNALVIFCQTLENLSLCGLYRELVVAFQILRHDNLSAIVIEFHFIMPVIISKSDYVAFLLAEVEFI